MGQSKDIVDRYTDFHWGNGPRKVVEVDDPELPDCTQMGPLEQLYVVTDQGDPLIVSFTPACHAVFDPKHPAERIHLVLCDAKRAEVEALFAESADLGVPVETLSILAKRAGGHHAEHAYPRLAAIDLGTVTDIVYGPTDKKGDGPSEYIHHFGIEGDEAFVVGGIQPRLAADEEGRLWLVGGDYTVPDEGITG